MHYILVTLFYFTLLYFTLLYFTLLYFTLLYFTLLYFTLLYFTLLYFTLLYFTLLYFTLLYFTLLYFTLLYFTLLVSFKVTTPSGRSGAHGLLVTFHVNQNDKGTVIDETETCAQEPISTSFKLKAGSAALTALVRK